MVTPREVLGKCIRNIKREWKVSFFAAFFVGLLIHLPIMLSDIPNHDGLGSMHFDQNMITSGRWFLSVACGVSSYYTLPWLIGLLALFYLGIAAVILAEILEIKDILLRGLISGMFVVFPAIASTFAYVFTMDGYMLALLLAVLSVLLVKKYPKGVIPGALCLAFSMGIYQAYLAFAVILCLYCATMVLIKHGEIKGKIYAILRYVCMGILGAGLYYVILQILLKVQGKELSDYQSINSMSGAAEAEGSFMAAVWENLLDICQDFVVFTLKGNVFCNNIFSKVAMLLLGGMFAITLLCMVLRRKWWKNPLFFVIIGFMIAAVPIAANLILLVSPEVNYHLLMRYQWILFPIIMIAFMDKYSSDELWNRKHAQWNGAVQWCVLAVAFILTFNYAVTDQIAYSNLEKRYEKTYAYCVRLLDRIEQTEGYYQGIPIAIVGVVGYEEFPVTDITEPVTGGMIGISGDTLLYTAENYEAFMKNYLGASLNFLDVDTVGKIYYSEEYIAMDSFPGENSVKLVDGVIYVKTENATRD